MKDLIQKIENGNQIPHLEGKQNIASLTATINALIDRVNELESQGSRDRGPKSEHSMSDDDARRVIGGDLKDTPHKECAELLGLSYGQVYSARGGYTFKHIHKEFEDQKSK